MRGIKIKSLSALCNLVKKRKSVVVPGTVWERPTPAAFVINLQGRVISRMIERGMFVYVKKSEKSPWNGGSF